MNNQIILSRRLFSDSSRLRRRELSNRPSTLNQGKKKDDESLPLTFTELERQALAEELRQAREILDQNPSTSMKIQKSPTNDCLVL